MYMIVTTDSSPLINDICHSFSISTPPLVDVARSIDINIKRSRIHLTVQTCPRLTDTTRYVKGRWSDGNETIQITDTEILWSTGLASPITLSEGGAELSGQTYSASLHADGRELVWGDGEVWTRRK